MINGKYHCPAESITFPDVSFCGDGECSDVCLDAQLCIKLDCGTCVRKRKCPYWHFITKELWKGD